MNKNSEWSAGILDNGSNFSRFHRGDLESAGLAEVAHYLKKAKQNLDYAVFALDNTDFPVVSEMLSPADNKLFEIQSLIVETRRSIEVAELNMVTHIEEQLDLAAEKETEEKKESN